MFEVLGSCTRARSTLPLSAGIERDRSDHTDGEGDALGLNNLSGRDICLEQVMILFDFLMVT